MQRYTQSYFQKIALLRGLVTRETSDGLDLSTGAELAVLASNFRNVRGRSVACVIMDEVAFWRSETTSNPDTETYAALVPSTARNSPPLRWPNTRRGLRRVFADRPKFSRTAFKNRTTNTCLVWTA